MVYIKCRNKDCFTAVELQMDTHWGACGYCPRCGTITRLEKETKIIAPEELDDYRLG